MPVLDDYLRLWIGESLLKQNEPIQAAELLETIPKIVPDSSLIAKAAYRTGEAWYSANVCFRAVEWLEKAVALAEKDLAAPLALWHQAECHIRENRLPEARTALKQLWLRYPTRPKRARRKPDWIRTGTESRGHQRPKITRFARRPFWPGHASGGGRRIAPISGDGARASSPV